MRNKKGFTLVELVIVIAVIAILAGVMIGTFASVVKKANESAKMQEMAAAKQEQTATDILEKLKNTEWLGWEDFEEKLATAVSGAVASSNPEETKELVKNAVEEAFAKYASSLGTSNTGLTEEQVKYIVETALSKVSYSGVTDEQVKAIVNNAVSGTSTLTKAQVQAIVDAAAAKNLTLAQVTAAITEATKNLADSDKVEDSFSKIEKNLTASIKDLKDSTLTASDIEALLAKYISNGVFSGDYTWYNANATTMEIKGEKAADQLVALSTLAKGGTSFAGKTIEIPANVDLRKTDFQPIMDFDGTLSGKSSTEKTEIAVNVKPVWNTLDGRNGDTMMNYLKANGVDRKDAVAYGLVASLEKGGVVENIKVVLSVNMTDPGNKYTYFGGIVGFLNGGTIRNCEVSGSITGYNRIGGVVGYALYGSIEDVIVNVSINSHMSEGAGYGYGCVGGIIGYANTKGIGDITLTRCKVTTSEEVKLTSYDAKDIGAFFGRLECKNVAEFGDNTKYKVNVDSCKFNETPVSAGSVTSEDGEIIGIQGKTNFSSPDSTYTVVK